MITVNLPNGGKAQFPDEMSHEEIQSVLAKQFGSPEKPWADVGREAVKNAPSSAVGLAENLWDAATHPKRTAKSMYQIARGGHWNVPGLGLLNALVPANEEEKLAYASAVQGVGERYGSVDKLKETLATDPVGFLSDASGVFGGAGMMVGASKAGRVAKAASNISDPLNAVRQTAALPMRAAGATKLPHRMYMGVIKPSKRSYMFSTPEKRAALFETAVREKVLPKQSGAQKLQRRLDPIQEQVETILDSPSPDSAGIERKGVVAKAIPTLERAAEQIAPTKTTRQSANVLADFIDSTPENIPPKTAQRLKSNTGRELHKQYGEMKNFEIETNKQLVRGLKEGLESKFPELKSLNAKSKELIDLKRAIEDAIPRIENRNLLGLSDYVLGAGAAGSSIAGVAPAVTGGALLAGKLVLGHPQVKSRLAIALARARKYPKLSTSGAAPRAVIAGTERYGR